MPVVQLAEGRRGRRRGGVGLTAQFPDELVRAACEAAWVVARSLDVAEVPRPLRPYLKMKWLPAAALAPIRRVLESDEGFRARVAEAANEDILGRPGFLFLVRPEGWEDELQSLAVASSEESTVLGLRRDVERLEARTADLEGRLQEALARVADAEQRLAGERARRAAADAEVTSLEERVDALRHERDDARNRVRRAEVRLAETEAHLAQAVADTNLAQNSPVSDEDRAENAAPAVDVDAVITAVAAATAAADALREALATAERALVPPRDHPDPSEEPTGSRPPASSPGRPVPARRRPQPLPLGVFDDSVEAANVLVRTPGVVLLVDGYNCTLRDESAAGLAIRDQRRRLVGALTSLATRTGVDVEVVFDGADTGDALGRGGARAGVRVTFSDAGVEADDVVIARAAAVPADRPVVVASSDRRVRDGARAAGANVISAEQLMSLVRTRR